MKESEGVTMNDFTPSDIKEIQRKAYKEDKEAQLAKKATPNSFGQSTSQTKQENGR